MAGNEAIVVDYLLKFQNSISINHLGVINRIQNKFSNDQIVIMNLTTLIRAEKLVEKTDLN
jgi:hypothetical protein